MILYPLEITEDGDLVTSSEPLDILKSELLSLLETAIGERPYRQDYGTKSFVITEIDLSGLIADISYKLNLALSNTGLSKVLINSETTLSDLQQGRINLVVDYTYEASDYTASLITFDYLKTFKN